jgi:2-methylcitrate dehydratase PrpD
MVVTENADFSRDYMASDKRAIGNAVQVFFKDGTSTERVAVEYPIGHRRRRSEGIPVLVAKFENALATHFDGEQTRRILDACADQQRLEAMTVPDFMSLWVKS